MLLTTFLLTVLVDLTVAIEVGMVLAAFLFMRRMAEVTNVSAITREFDEDGGRRRRADPNAVRRRAVPPGVEVYEINGPFFFGAAETFKDTLTQLRRQAEGADHPHAPRARRSTRPACTRCATSSRRFRGAGTLVHPVRRPRPADGRASSARRWATKLPEDNLVGNIDDALNAARAHLGLEPVARPAFAVPAVAREDRRRAPAAAGLTSWVSSIWSSATAWQPC